MKMYKIVLVGNYSKQNQESMDRFLNILAIGLLQNKIEYKIWTPITLLGYFFSNTNSGFGKWFAYFDKFIITPIVFAIKLLINKFQKAKIVYHICDHSNAVYVPLSPKKKLIITCHDVLAIRGALGFNDAYCKSSGFGKKLQNNILKNLSKNIRIAFVSDNTFKQFREIAFQLFPENYRTILNGLNANFNKLSLQEIDQLKSKYTNFPSSHFLLHVGSNLERKNRKLLLNMLYELKDNYTGIICFAGQKPSEEIFSLASQLNLLKRIFFIEKPNHELLNLLYNTCDTFVFPSFSEGFGWPVIEAQICGAPVICSNIKPLSQIGGKGVLTANPANAIEFSEQFLLLKNTILKEKLVQFGIENAQQFSAKQMIENYIGFYKSIL